MTEYIIMGILACGVVLWLYCCHKDAMSEKREKKAIKKALKEVGYV